MTRRRSLICALAALGVLAGCGGEKPPTGSFPESCAGIETLDNQEASEFFASVAELSATSDDEKNKLQSEAAEDWPRFRPLLVRICELSRANALPGGGSIEGNGKFWTARARREHWIDVTEGIAPATAERQCDRLWFMVLEMEGRNEARYFFCDTAEGFALISGYEKQDESWVKLD